MTKTSDNGSSSTQTILPSFSTGALVGTTSMTISGPAIVTSNNVATAAIGLFEGSVNRTGCTFFQSTPTTLTFPGTFTPNAIVNPLIGGDYDGGSNTVKFPTFGVYRVYWQNTGDSGVVFNRLQSFISSAAFTGDNLFQYIGFSNGAIRTADMGWHWNYNVLNTTNLGSERMSLKIAASNFAVTNHFLQCYVCRIKGHS